jgi:hypothetical protein
VRGYDISLDKQAVAQMKRRLAKAPETVKLNVSKVAFTFASEIASSAAGRATRSPSGLWKGAGPANYNVKEFDGGFSVRTPGGKAGRALAMSEFAIQHKPLPGKPGGTQLGRTLSGIYGAPGRILWATYDARERLWIRAVENAVADTAADIEGGA